MQREAAPAGDAPNSSPAKKKTAAEVQRVLKEPTAGAAHRELAHHPGVTALQQFYQPVQAGPLLESVQAAAVEAELQQLPQAAAEGDHADMLQTMQSTGQPPQPALTHCVKQTPHMMMNLYRPCVDT